jgi:hypothetical protein
VYLFRHDYVFKIVDRYTSEQFPTSLNIGNLTISPCEIWGALFVAS